MEYKVVCRFMNTIITLGLGSLDDFDVDMRNMYVDHLMGELAEISQMIDPHGVMI